MSYSSGRQRRHNLEREPVLAERRPATYGVVLVGNDAVLWGPGLTGWAKADIDAELHSMLRGQWSLLRGQEALRFMMERHPEWARSVQESIASLRLRCYVRGGKYVFEDV